MDWSLSPETLSDLKVVQLEFTSIAMECHLNTSILRGNKYFQDIPRAFLFAIHYQHHHRPETACTSFFTVVSRVGNQGVEEY